MVLSLREECTLWTGSGGRTENVWPSFAWDKGRVRECGDDEGDELPVRRASGTPEMVLEGGVLIVSWQLLAVS